MLTNELKLQGDYKTKLVSTVNISMEDILTAWIPTLWPFLKISDLIASVVA